MGFARHIRNQKGFSMTELLIVSTIGVFLLGAAGMVFVSQQSSMKAQREHADINALGRFAVEDIAKMLRETGYGLPTGQGVTSANTNTITLLSNTDNVTTTLSADISAGATSFTVASAANFAAGDKVAVYMVFSSSTYDLKTISSIAGNVITVSNAFANAYSTSQSISVSKYHQISLAVDNVSHTVTKTVDGGVATTIIGSVASNGLSFAYKDNAEAALSAPVGTPSNIRKIAMTLNMQDPENSNIMVTFKTDVNMRNMGT